jgi:NAD(P)-dependent dehydrogenase (short-subunit alcohol dehydrogenase family)
MPLPANPARLDCSGRRVLITAGASGIGAAMAQAFAGAGARVHVCDMDQARIDEFLDANPGITATRCDVTDEAGVREMETPIWMQTYAVNVHGTFFTTRAALPHLRAANGASIINMSSVAGRLGFPLRSAYVGSKWALIGLTKTWAMEFGPQNIRVNALLPGLVEGPRIRAVIAARSAATGQPPDKILEGFLRDISLRRMVTPTEVANMALYLLSPLGMGISGEAISIDGHFEVIR